MISRIFVPCTGGAIVPEAIVLILRPRSCAIRDRGKGRKCGRFVECTDPAGHAHAFSFQARFLMIFGLYPRCLSLHQGDLSRQPPKLAYSVREVMAALGLAWNTICERINGGRLHSIKIVSRRIIPASGLHEVLGGAAA